MRGGAGIGGGGGGDGDRKSRGGKTDGDTLKTAVETAKSISLNPMALAEELKRKFGYDHYAATGQSRSASTLNVLGGPLAFCQVVDPKVGWQVGSTGASGANLSLMKSTVTPPRPVAHLSGVTSTGKSHPNKHKPPVSTYLDDFRQGFPAKGLSSVSTHWWGSADPVKPLKISQVSVEEDAKDCSPECAKEDAKAGYLCSSDCHMENEKNLMPWTIIARTRRRAALNGRKALGVAVAKGYGTKKLTNKERNVLRFVFGDTYPEQWLAALPNTGGTKPLV